LFAGKLVPFKRPLDVVEAAAAAKQAGRDVAVMIAGAGMLRTEIVARAAARGVPLHDLGFCNQTEMPAAYAAADILVLPSDARETWGLVANEALACGRPIVLAETVGSAPDLAADGTAGEVFPLGDVAALSAATCRMMVSPPSPIQIAAKSATYSLTAAAQGIADAAEWAKRARGGAARSVQPATRTRLRVR